MILSPSTKGQKILDRVKTFLSENVDPIESQFSVSNFIHKLFVFYELVFTFQKYLENDETLNKAAEIMKSWRVSCKFYKLLN